MTTSAGPRILVAEDSGLIALEFVDVLSRAGYEVVGPVASVDRAVAMVAAEALDAAVLDVHLRGGSCQPVADALDARAVPFVLITGYDEPMIVGGVRGHLRKPIDEDDLIAAVADLLGTTIAC